jgi:hypothetical protein
MSAATLILDLKSYWHTGTGRGAGTALDAVTHRDSRGLPALPGRTVKGLLRDVVRQAEVLGWYGAQQPSVEEQLFGWRTRAGMSPPDRVPQCGCLHVGDAGLPAGTANYLAAHRELLPGLYRSHFSTRIDPTTGTAQEQTLRGAEVIVPLALRAQIVEIQREQPPPADWPALLQLALPLLRGLGEFRTRGLGRVIATLEVC